MCFTDGGKIGGVKCQNMLLRPKFIIRIADFSLDKEFVYSIQVT